MLGHRGSNSHKRRLDNTPKLERRCTLYTSPTSTSTLPVFEQLDITWDPSCLSISSSEIDLYLNVQSTAGLQAVHEWTGVTYSAGKLSTQLNPGWWNASTGAGTVSAQFIITPSGSPIWDTSAPSGPSFSISYNGSYPSATASAVSPSYTGPSVESVSTPSTSVSGGKLGAAIAVPLLAVIAALGAYIAWNKWRKKPEKKRWSAVIDKRMSMISSGTAPPPRHSMASRPGSLYSQRPGSLYSGQHRPSGSVSRSPLSNSFDGRPVSGYSASASSPLSQHRPSASIYDAARPTSSYSASVPHRPSASIYDGRTGHPSSPLAGPRPPPPAEMRQVGVGERNSRLSFADDASAKRKSMTRQSSYYANGRNSMHGSINSSSGVPVPPLPRSGSTSEDLAPFLLAQAPRSPTRRPNAPRKPSHLVNQSIGSLNYADYPALQLVRDPELVFPTGAPNSPTPGTSDPDGPFADPPTPPPPAAGHASHMPFFGLRSSILSPDELLNRYTRERAGAVSPTAPAPRTQGRTGGWARLLPRSWSSKKNVHEDARTENAVEREKSPFDDAAEKASSTPDSPASSMKNSPSEPEEEASWGQAL